jgi:DHA2 family multidrug resistance protein
MQQATDRLHTFGFTDFQAYTLLARSISGQAYLLAADDLFWISGWLSIGAVAFVWLARRSFGSNVTAGAD